MYANGDNVGSKANTQKLLCDIYLIPYIFSKQTFLGFKNGQ